MPLGVKQSSSLDFVTFKSLASSWSLDFEVWLRSLVYAILQVPWVSLGVKQLPSLDFVTFKFLSSSLSLDFEVWLQWLVSAILQVPWVTCKFLGSHLQTLSGSVTLKFPKISLQICWPAAGRTSAAMAAASSGLVKVKKEPLTHGEQLEAISTQMTGLLRNLEAHEAETKDMIVVGLMQLRDIKVCTSRTRKNLPNLITKFQTYLNLVAEKMEFMIKEKSQLAELASTFALVAQKTKSMEMQQKYAGEAKAYAGNAAVAKKRDGAEPQEVAVAMQKGGAEPQEVAGAKKKEGQEPGKEANKWLAMVAAEEEEEERLEQEQLAKRMEQERAEQEQLANSVTASTRGPGDRKRRRWEDANAESGRQHSRFSDPARVL